MNKVFMSKGTATEHDLMTSNYILSSKLEQALAALNACKYIATYGDARMLPDLIHKTLKDIVGGEAEED